MLGHVSVDSVSSTYVRGLTRRQQRPTTPPEWLNSLRQQYKYTNYVYYSAAVKQTYALWVRQT
jgi:hypothetical protein